MGDESEIGIRFDEVARQVRVLERVAESLLSAQTRALEAQDAHTETIWPAGGSTAAFRTSLRSALVASKSRLSGLEVRLVETAQDLRDTVSEFRAQDEARAARYTRAIDAVVARLEA